jgi:glycosyltransferase involved in cell wall biosynthesis
MQQDWIAAATAYRQALTHAPHLHHIWVQLGHVEKEAGNIDGAKVAYEEAALLKPEDAEPLLHLGHMAKRWYQPETAVKYFIRALQRDQANLQAVSELARLTPGREDMDSATWQDVLSVLHIDHATQMTEEEGQLSRHSVILDVTDLLAFFGQRRLPTGIQRVQIEVSLALLQQSGEAQVIFCIYSSARRGWIKIPANYFEIICNLAKESDDLSDEIWMESLFRMYCIITFSKMFLFSLKDTLINLGTSWSDRNYLLDVRTERDRNQIIYIPLVFDLIPLINKNWFMQSLVHDYRAWFQSLLYSADGYLAISQATRRDLLQKSVQFGLGVEPDSISVLPLNGNFRQSAASADILQAYGLAPRRYVLLVSTLEPRKNHKGAFSAWLTLADTLGEAAMPHLVCVGGRGWLNEDLHQMLREHPSLTRMVQILHGVPDDRLAALYEHCLFTLYPSFYEGWGLPVSESLSYGKVPAISCTSSLPEAGGPYACYFDPENPADIAAKVRSLLDEERLNAAEVAIAQDYEPQTWHDIARDLLSHARDIVPRVETALVRIDGAGTWDLANAQFTEDDKHRRSGEALRFGRGWLTPIATGCGIKGDDAALRFHWAGRPDAVLHIYCFGSRDAQAEVAFDGLPRIFRIEDGLPTIIPCPLPQVAGPMRITIVPVAGDVFVGKVVVTHAPAVIDKFSGRATASHPQSETRKGSLPG